MSTLERTKLYKNVWSRPCTKMAAELGFSNNAMKRRMGWVGEAAAVWKNPSGPDDSARSNR